MRQPVSAQVQRRAQADVLRKRTAKVMGEFAQLWARNGVVLSDQQLASAIGNGEAPRAWVDIWSSQYLSAINNHIAPVWGEALNAGATIMSRGLVQDGSSAVIHLLGEAMDSWVKSHSGELVRELTGAQHRAINFAIRQAVSATGMTSKTLAKVIRPMVGLTTSEGGVLVRLAAAMSADGARPEAIAARVAAEAQRKRMVRATRIARTELVRAYNMGGHITVATAQAAGILPSGEVFKVWSTARDEAVCPICGPLDGVRVGMDGGFEDGHTGVTVAVPPVHPNCRCTLLYVTP